MKTFTRMIRRYVLATAAVVLLVVGLLLGLTVYLGLHYGETSDDRARIGTLAEALTPTADGLQFDPAQTPAQWMQGYAWAMVLDGDGTVIWQYDLPQNLNKHYTASEIASFSRWYLDDWPVFCWTADYGLFVAAQPRGSVWKYNIYSSAALMYAAAAGLLPTLAAVLRENALELTVADDGAGYPAAVLHALQTGETGANTPHILGLHVVEQIAQAHGGSVQFMQNAPQGAKAVVTLPTENQAHR